MTATAILERARSDGVTLIAEGGMLRYRGPEMAVAKLLPALKEHKADLLAALSGKINRWRVTHADGRIIEHSSAGLTEAEALALSRSWGEPVRAEPIAEATPSPPADLGALLASACQGVPGIDAKTFRALLSPVDVEDSEGGQYPNGDAQCLRQELLRRYTGGPDRAFGEAGVMAASMITPRAAPSPESYPGQYEESLVSFVEAFDAWLYSIGGGPEFTAMIRSRERVDQPHNRGHEHAITRIPRA